jgi:hypothetical protein
MSGMGSSLFYALFIPANVSVGASGAIIGLVGGTLSDLTLHPNKVNRQINMLNFVSFIYAEQRKIASLIFVLILFCSRYGLLLDLSKSA